MHAHRAIYWFAPLLILILFAPVLIGTDRLAFRDVSHFYTPLYDYLGERTSDQWLPLWNPLDQTGMPLLGETTTAVLYPIRYLLFGLPISSEIAIAWYVALHLIIASFGATFAARCAGVRSTWAALAGIAYPLSGSVLFLYCNPPFLVGAAWLPTVLGLLLAEHKPSDQFRISVGGLAMAMMILGGDPQTALHAMIIAGVFYIGQWILRLDRNLSAASLVGVPIVAALVSAPQLAASVAWSQHSDRLVDNRVDSFDYSSPPWHLAELLTNNAFGSYFPIHRRVSQLIVGDGRMWTPTIYMGIFVLVGLAMWIGNLRRTGTDRWSWVAGFSLWLAMGHFGLVMLIQWLTGALMDVDSAVGGPYWLLYQLVPGYDAFRYPAKWLPVFALACSIGVTRTLDRFDWDHPPWKIVTCVGSAVLFGLVVVTALKFQADQIAANFGVLPQDEFWGPLDMEGGFTGIQWSLVLSLIMLLAIGMVFAFRFTNETRRLALLSLLVVDLGIANQMWIASISRKREESLLVQAGCEPFMPGSRWMRTRSGTEWPHAWRHTSDALRLLDVEASLRLSRFGRWHLADRVGMVNNMVSIQSQAMSQFWRWTQSETAEMSSTERGAFWNRVRDWLSIDGTIHSGNLAFAVTSENRTATMVDPRTTWKPFSTDLRLLSEVRTNNQGNPDGDWNDLIRFTPQQSSVGTRQVSRDTVAYQSVTLDAPGWLMRPVFQDGYWSASVRATGTSSSERITDVKEFAGICQAIKLPAGTWDIRFHYRPWWIVPSLMISIATLIAGAGLICQRLFRSTIT